MTDTVSTKVILDGNRNYVAVFQNDSDGTGESAVTKVDISTLGPGPDSVNAPASVAIEAIEWDVQGMDYVELLLGSTHVSNLSGQGYKDYHGEWFSAAGDLVLTTQNAVPGGSYDITVKLKKRS